MLFYIFTFFDIKLYGNFDSGFFSYLPHLSTRNEYYGHRIYVILYPTLKKHSIYFFLPVTSNETRCRNASLKHSEYKEGYKIFLSDWKSWEDSCNYWILLEIQSTDITQYVHVNIKTQIPQSCGYEYRISKISRKPI